MKSNGIIGRRINALIWAIKISPEYREYKFREAQLACQQELKQRVDEYRKHNFQMQNDTEDIHMMEAISNLNKEGEELKKNPVAAAYLQAELDLCRLLQKISLEVNCGLDIQTPDL